MDQYQFKLFNPYEELDRGNVGQKGRMVILWTSTSLSCSTFEELDEDNVGQKGRRVNLWTSTRTG